MVGHFLVLLLPDPLWTGQVVPYRVPLIFHSGSGSNRTKKAPPSDAINCHTQDDLLVG